MIDQNSNPNCSGYEVVNKWLDVCVSIAKGFSSSILLSMAGISSFPIIYAVMYGGTTDLLPLHLPYVDESTVIGYIQLTIFQFMMLMIGVCGLIVADLMMFLFFMYLAPLCDLLRLRIKEINSELKRGDQTVTSEEFNTYLMNLTEIHKDMCR